MRKLLVFTAVPLLAVCLSLQGVQATQIGVPVPKPTATGQSITSSTAAPFTWTPVTLPYGVNGTGQMAVGGTVDATTRLSVNPTGAAENGLTVNMPSGATGYALNVVSAANTAAVHLKYNNSVGGPGLLLEGGSLNGFDIGTLSNQAIRLYAGTTYSNGPAFQIWPTGTGNQGIYFDAGSATGADIHFRVATTGGGDFITGKQGTGLVGFNQTSPQAQVHVTSRNITTSAMILQAASGQTADILDLNDSTNAVKAKIDKNFVMSAKGFASSVRVVTAADTAALSDSVLLCNGTFTETLPATGYPTGYRLTVKDTGTGTVTLTAGGTVTFDGATTVTFATQYKSRVFVFDGVNFQIESGLL